jgi:2-dehydro-3-deoxyphosphogalactonate aldolase
MTTAAHVAWPHFDRALVAILRGIAVTDVEPIVGALIEAGFEAIEIPLNSPDPLTSIAKAVRLAPAGCLVGAGTVLSVQDVDCLADVGGRLMVSPNTDTAVIARAAERGMVTMPGVLTPTEAFTALKAGASALKFFPASLLGPATIQAIGAVLPKGVQVGVVGGVSDKDFAAYAAVGVRIFGLGSSLFKPAMTVTDVAARAKAAIAAYDAVYGRSA